MRPHSTLACSIACAMLLLAAPSPAQDGYTRIRALDHESTKLIEEARAGSPTVQRLLDRLEGSDLITYIKVGYRPEKPRATTAIISAVPDVRYVLIVIGSFTSATERHLLLGHELQHAVELADNPEVRDERGMERLYKRIGWREDHRTYETAAAQAMGRQVQVELRAARVPVVAAAR